MADAEGRDAPDGRDDHALTHWAAKVPWAFSWFNARRGRAGLRRARVQRARVAGGQRANDGWIQRSIRTCGRKTHFSDINPCAVHGDDPVDTPSAAARGARDDRRRSADA